MGFAQSLKMGRIAESLIARWMIGRGTCILPAYEIEVSSGKGPQLFCPSGSYVSPDLLAFTKKGLFWIEAKHKTVFAWNRSREVWVTGIDLHHYGQYMQVAKQTNLPVWLLFFHRESTPSPGDILHGCPPECPTGLFGGELFDLVTKENHRSPPLDFNREGIKGHGRSGMVYWDPSALQLLATKEEVIAASEADPVT